MQEHCWEMQELCECRGVEPEESSCPAYHSQKSCWDYDWLSFYAGLPASQQEYWSHRFRGCIDCDAFALFDPEMRTNIIMLKEHYPSD